jgi:hypothetical protein
MRMRIEDMGIELLGAEAFSGRKGLKANGVMRLYWTSRIGFGTYDLIINEGKGNGVDCQNDLVVNGYSECMDSDGEKGLIKELMRQFIERIRVVD